MAFTICASCLAEKNGRCTNQYSCEHGSIQGNSNWLGFGICVNTNLVYQYRTLLRLREQSFEIHFSLELWIGTPLRRNLLSTYTSQEDSNQNFDQKSYFRVMHPSAFWSESSIENLSLSLSHSPSFSLSFLSLSLFWLIWFKKRFIVSFMGSKYLIKII